MCYRKSLALAVQCETMHGVMSHPVPAYEFCRGFCTLVLFIIRGEHAQTEEAEGLGTRLDKRRPVSTGPKVLNTVQHLRTLTWAWALLLAYCASARHTPRIYSVYKPLKPLTATVLALRLFQEAPQQIINGQLALGHGHKIEWLAITTKN